MKDAHAWKEERYNTGIPIAQFHAFYKGEKPWAANSQYGYPLSWHKTEKEALEAARKFYAKRKHLLARMRA